MYPMPWEFLGSSLCRALFDVPFRLTLPVSILHTTTTMHTVVLLLLSICCPNGNECDFGLTKVGPRFEGPCLFLSHVLSSTSSFPEGSHIECQYALTTFGIPRDAMPVDTDGKTHTHFHLAWLERQRMKEEAELLRCPSVRLPRLQQQPTTEAVMSLPLVEGIDLLQQSGNKIPPRSIHGAQCELLFIGKYKYSVNIKAIVIHW